MSKCTKGELEIMPYTRRDGDNIRWVKDAKGQSICQTFRPRAKANAEEIVLRWNAFEDGGLVEELRTACEKVLNKPELHYQPLNTFEIEALEAALAKS